MSKYWFDFFVDLQSENCIQTLPICDEALDARLIETALPNETDSSEQWNQWLEHLLQCPVQNVTPPSVYSKLKRIKRKVSKPAQEHKPEKDKSDGNEDSMWSTLEKMIPQMMAEEESKTAQDTQDAEDALNIAGAQDALDAAQKGLQSMYEELPKNVSETIKDVMSDLEPIVKGDQPKNEHAVMSMIEKVEKTFRKKMESNEITEEDIKQTAGIMKEHLFRFKDSLPKEIREMVEMFGEYINDSQDSAAPMDTKEMSNILVEFMDFSKDMQSGRNRSAHPFVKRMMSKLQRIMISRGKKPRVKLSMQDRLRLKLERKQKEKAEQA
jgi:hypothetical protein